MYVITNRNLLVSDFQPFSKEPKEVFGAKPNEEGPNEVRLFEAKRVNKQWRAALIPDTPSPDEAKAISWCDPNESVYGSHLVAQRVVDRARTEKRNILLFVHGYNNDIHDVLDRAEHIEQLYGVIVVPFSWPADGGGTGLVSYKSDKRDARISIGALDRVLFKAAEYLSQINATAIAEAKAIAEEKFPKNSEKQNALFSKLQRKSCPFQVCLMLHSMGNFLYKQLLKSTASEGNRLLFDNVVLVAADTNNLDHSFWVDQIQFRQRVYITINEKDQALAASRAKGGEDQLARLGHYPFDLDSRHAVYVNFSSAPWVGDSHAYFEGKPAKKNDRVRKFFHRALNGKIAEEIPTFVPDRNFYQVK